MVQTIGLDMGMAQYATSLASELCFFVEFTHRLHYL